jgi:poly(hydroxyalkanoate) granule-associated protein
MARKNKSGPGRARSGGGDPSQSVRDSAQKVWLAGLGALERAKTDGPRVFETLVEQGRKMGARAVGAADEALKQMRQANYSGGNFQKVEQMLRDLNDSVRKMTGVDASAGGRAAAARPARKSRKKKTAAGGARRATAKRAARKPGRKAARKAKSRA